MYSSKLLYLWFQDITVFAQQTRINNSPTMLGFLKVWIWIQEEKLAELTFMEEVCKVFHCVGSQTSNVVVLTGVQKTKSFNSVDHVVGHLNSNLHSKSKFVRISLAETYQKSSITASNISKLHFISVDCGIKLSPIVQAWVTWAEVNTC